MSTAERFAPRGDDVYIASYPRSGTTWMQMIVFHLLRDPGASFEHLSQVIPFFERAIRTQRFNDLPVPRIFKTHFHHRHAMARPGRFVYVMRDGRDVLVSYFHFHQRYFGANESFAQFFDRFMAGRVLYGSWFQHVAGWQAHAADERILFVRYEDLSSQWEAQVHRIAAFLGCEISPARLALVSERCSFAAMRADESKFDAAVERRLETGEPATVMPGAFLRRGQVDGWREMLTAAQARAFDVAVREQLSVRA